MVLTRALTEEERKRQEKLIKRYFARGMWAMDEVEVEFHDNGSEKGVYKVHLPRSTVLAAAANRDEHRGEEIDMVKEYTNLHKLYNSAPEFFPKPIAHYTPKSSDPEFGDLGHLIIMELLEHENIQRFKNDGTPKDFREKLARGIGRSVALVNEKTGMYMTQPHDGNILIQTVEDGEGYDLDFRFCDAVQYDEGPLEEAVRMIMTNNDERPECYRQIRQFRDGLAEGIQEETGMSIEEAREEVSFIRRYNPIF